MAGIKSTPPALEEQRIPGGVDPPSPTRLEGAIAPCLYVSVSLTRRIETSHWFPLQTTICIEEMRQVYQPDGFLPPSLPDWCDFSQLKDSKMFGNRWHDSSIAWPGERGNNVMAVYNLLAVWRQALCQPPCAAFAKMEHTLLQQVADSVSRWFDRCSQSCYINKNILLFHLIYR